MIVKKTMARSTKGRRIAIRGLEPHPFVGRVPVVGVSWRRALAMGAGVATDEIEIYIRSPGWFFHPSALFGNKRRTEDAWDP